MNPSDFSPELQAELIDDFHVEADEHLGNIRAQLSVLEQAMKRGVADTVALESLFRSMHSLKGISAIVGLRSVESLAHAAEDYLRQLSRGERTLGDDGLQVLIDATHRLEQIVSAHRLHKPLPETQGVVERLAPYRQSPAAPTVAPVAPLSPKATPATAPAVDVEALRARGLLPWRCVFSPNKTLDARGINVNAVRTRLGERGEIIRATPQIGAGGSMSFEFIAGLRETPTDLAAWEADGLVLAPLENEAPRQKAPDSSTAPAQANEAVSSLFIAPSHVVRVDLSRLDELMRIAGELVIHRSRLDERLYRTVGDASNDRSGLQEVNLALMRSLRELRNAIGAVRLVSMGEIFTRMPFVVRDLAREMNKKARLVVQGQNTEVDKHVVERLKEPLLHLVRNALSHGIETPEERVAAGKSPEATVLLDATISGEWVVIRVRDDGRGVDAEKIVARALALGVPIPAVLDSAGILELLCAPGFSTRDEADLAAGRGVGMAVVWNTVRQFGGSVTMDTQLGGWTQFTLKLPLTLSIMAAFIVAAADQVCAVPQNAVREIVQLPASGIHPVNGAEVVPYRGALLPLFRLRTLFHARPSVSENLTIVVVTSERGLTGLVVDRVINQREIVVRPLQDPLIQVSGISGATELGDGRPVLILDAATLTRGVVRPHSGMRAEDGEMHSSSLAV